MQWQEWDSQYTRESQERAAAGCDNLMESYDKLNQIWFHLKEVLGVKVVATCGALLHNLVTKMIYVGPDWGGGEQAQPKLVGLGLGLGSILGLCFGHSFLG